VSGYSKQEISVHRKGLLFLGDAFFFTIDGANPFQALAIDEYVTVVNCETVLSEKAHDFSSASYKLIKVARNTDEICHAAIQVSDIFLLCNNHTLDQGVDGLLATSRWLRQRGKTAIGTHTHSHAELTIAGKQVAVYSFTDIPGRKYRLFPGEKDALKAVSRLKNQFDLLAVGVHWGREYADYPSPRQRQLAQRLIENGADFIIGHHPHVFQGVEFFHGRPVYYSLGNSNFGTWQNRFSPWSYFALVVTCDLSNGTFCFKEHFYRINNQLKL
jgi:poly-gamma-glutamate synthesis protein (capsule biosynthesis protein)